MHCIHEHDHTPAYIQQLCALKARLAILKEKYEELKENEEQSSQASEETDTAKQIEELLNTIISGLVSENEFEEYKKQQAKKGYLTEIDPIYITEEELKEILKNLFISNDYPEYKKWLFDILKDYIKLSDVNLKISEYLQEHDITQFVDIQRLVDEINNLIDKYYTKDQIDNKISTTKNELITLINSGKTITKDQFGYAPAVTENTSNSYLIGTLTLPSNTYRLYGKDNTGSSGGPGSYDDTNIRSIISNLQAQLNDIKEGNKTDIERTVKEIIYQFEWLKENVDWGEVFHTSGWNEGFNAYLQTVGLISPDGSVGQWTALKQSFDELSAQVTAIKQSIGENGELDFETLQNNLKSYVDVTTGNAVVNAVSKYALTDKDGYVLNWFASGFESQASRGGSFSQLYSTTERAVSALRTDVDDIKANAILAAQFDERVAGVIASATVSRAILDLIGDSVTITADSLNMVSRNPQNTGVIKFVYDTNGFPEMSVKADDDDAEDELSFGIITTPSISASNITPTGQYSKSASLFFADGSARLANGNLWWDDQGLLHLQYADIRDSRFENIDTSDFEAQSVKISANVFQNNVWNTGMYLYNPNTPTAYKWHRVVVDQNGFLRVDMDSQGDL